VANINSLSLNASGAAVIGSITLLALADYQYATDVEPDSVTFMGAILNVTYWCDTAQTGPIAFYCGVRNVDQAGNYVTVGSVGDPGVQAQLANEDWLWVSHTYLPDYVGVFGSANWNSMVQNVRIKARRKLRGEEIAFVAKSAAAATNTDLTISVQARLLLKFA